MKRELSPALQKVIAAYARELPSKLAEIQAAWDAAEAAGWPQDQLEEIYHRVHKLAGSSGSYGFPDLSQTARKLDRLLNDVRAGEAPWNAEAGEQMFQAIADEVTKAAG